MGDPDIVVGIFAAGMYAQLTTGKPLHIVSGYLMIAR